ncbi:MAG: carboxypeptidase-like regulatory domain-containing protein, partial [Flavobacterium sp.]|nr:carboxypeptidase-like regulatory domain-containing protein [Flavobacterium sp.]
MKTKLFILFLFVSLCSVAQTGTVSGVILDKEYENEPLPFATVLLKGTKQGTTTDDKGKYSLTVKPGNYTLVVSYLGYETKEIPFTIKAGEKKVINHTLEASGVQLQDIVVEYTVKKESEQALLQEQQKAVEIKQSIGAIEMAKKGVSDVAAAVVKTAGVTKQEGTSNIFVRGLGDRYNSTSLNGLPIPSNNPEKKNIALDLFNVDIVEYISIDKVYNSKMYGDFAGGNVDIHSKDFSGEAFLKLDAGVNLNSNAIAQNNFLLQDGPSTFGFSKSALPNSLSEFGFENSLNPVSKTPFGFNFGLNGGKKFNFGENSSLSLFSTVSFGNEFAYREGIDRNVNNIGTPTKDFRSESFGYKTNTTGMLNAVYKINNNNKLKYNFIFINSSEQSNENYSGTIIDIADNDNGLLNRKTYEVNSVFINQLLGEHKFSERTNLNWGVSYNSITSDMPDRIQNTFRFENGGYVFGQNQITDNHRYFQSLVENEAAVNVSVDVKFKKKEDDSFKGKMTFGYSARYKVRDFEATQFNFRILQNQTVDPNNLDTFFNQANLSNGFFEIATFRGNQFVPNALRPQVYSGTQIINAGFGNVEYQFNDKFTAVVGLRTEQIFQEVEWNTQIDPSDRKDGFDRVEFLPSAILRYGINEKQNIRFGASKTYTLPQIKERALFVYEDVTQIKVGNPDLYPSEDYNVDLKWELFPAKEELISVTTFGKYILNPINEVTISSA